MSVDSQKLANLLNKAKQIQQSAKNSFGIVLAASSFALIIRQYLEQLKSLESSIAAFDAEIARLIDNFDTNLESITGVGKTLAAVIFSEIGGDIQRPPQLLPRQKAVPQSPRITTLLILPPLMSLTTPQLPMLMSIA